MILVMLSRLSVIMKDENVLVSSNSSYIKSTNAYKYRGWIVDVNPLFQ